MDRTRPLRLDHPLSASSSTSSTSSVSRPKPASASKDPVKRKPLPGATSSPTTGHKPPLDPSPAPAPEEPSRSHPIFQQPLPTIPQIPTSSPIIVPRDLDQYPRGLSPQSQNGLNGHFPSITSLESSNSPAKGHRPQASESKINDASKIKRVPVNQGLQRAKSLHPTGKALPAENVDDETYDPAMITKTPRSPGPNKLTSFFGWKTSPTPTPVAEVSPPPRSDKSFSPAPSPKSPASVKTAPANNTAPIAIDTSTANSDTNSTFFADVGHFPMPPMNAPHLSVNAQVDDLEDELREISSELAGSIRREMELEDLVDRLQLEASQGPDLGRRTSDYFSDSGSGSIRYPGSDAGITKLEDFAKQKRISEQEKAQFKLSLSHKLQDERGRRKVLEAHIQQLGEQMQNFDQERADTSGVANRVRDLESSLEDHRRRLTEERRAKENFEDMMKALKGEMSQSRDERDNLRDEVVPHLQARLDGLESQASEHPRLSVENDRLQQDLQSLRNELHSLKNENTTLMNARRLQLEMQQHSSRFNSIAEEGGPSPTEPTGLGLTRSASIARGTGLARSGSLKRSNSVSNKEREINDRVKDIEMQRDALHKALKLLLDRQNLQNREYEKRLKLLELERDRALENQSPRRMGYEKEVTGLKFEINQLRRRADDAIQQKYQCEKGLGGLKKDLDRAEQETTSLRTLLQEHDILVPDKPGARSQGVEAGAHATSTSLEGAYRDLQRTQALSINRLRELHGGVPSSADDADTAVTMETLLRSMSNAEAERDFAQKQASILRAQAESLKEAESYQSEENAGLSEQLRAAANRVEGLSSQVRGQLESNSNLRERLAEAVGRGEEEQKNSTTRINSMQGRLKSLEDKLMVAQQHSEEALGQHEEEVRVIHDSHNNHLRRLGSGMKLRTHSTLGTPRSSNPISPIFQSRSPRLDKTTSGIGRSLDEALRTEFLEKRVAELEGALSDADKEMEEVVSRMNLAQIEVMELQSARDDAMRQTRKLQSEITAENEKVNSLTTKSLFRR